LRRKWHAPSEGAAMPATAQVSNRYVRMSLRVSSAIECDSAHVSPSNWLKSR
jgi:hypothetical protein